MAIIEDKKVKVIEDEPVEPTIIKSISFSKEPIRKYEKDGVNKTLNGYNTKLIDILLDISYMLDGELNGAKLIAEMEPDTVLYSKNLDLNEDIYGTVTGVKNPVITVTEEEINQAKYTVQQYEYLLRLINLLRFGAIKVENTENNTLSE